MQVEKATLESVFLKVIRGNTRLMFEKKIKMNVVIGLGGRYFGLCTLFWDGDEWVRYVCYDYKLFY